MNVLIDGKLTQHAKYLPCIKMVKIIYTELSQIMRRIYSVYILKTDSKQSIQQLVYNHK